MITIEGERSAELLLSRIRRELRALADPARASAMRSYMRSSVPFLGVPAPVVHGVVRAITAELRFRSSTAWKQATRFLWDHARFREERYATVGLCRSTPAKPYQTPSALALYGAMISSGAWWDYVDELAIHGVGPILRAYPGPSRPVLRRWSRSSDLWLRRASIIAQVGSKKATDLALLDRCIAPSLASREFFLRKAIGWALRQEARIDPVWVQRYVETHAAELSPLSRREALRHLVHVSGPELS